MDIKEVRQRTDLVKLIEDCGVELHGTHTLSGICPFHDDRTPSLRVQPSRQWFWCYACQTGGDVFSWVMKIEDCTFSQSLEKIGRGNLLSPIIRTQRDRPRKNPPLIPNMLVEDCHQELMRRPQAVTWLEDHKSWSLQTIVDHKIGFDQSSYRFTIPVPSPILNCWEDLRMYDPFGNRPQKMMPYQSGGTYLPYILVHDYSYLLIVEGEPDALACHSIGLNVATNTCGSGSAPNTWQQWSGLVFAPIVVLCFDLDEAGHEALWGCPDKKNPSILRRNGLTRIFPDAVVANLPSELGAKGDISDAIRKYGPEWTKSFIMDHVKGAVVADATD